MLTCPLEENSPRQIGPIHPCHMGMGERTVTNPKYTMQLLMSIYYDSNHHRALWLLFGYKMQNPYEIQHNLNSCQGKLRIFSGAWLIQTVSIL